MRPRPRVIAVCCFFAVMFAYAATNAYQTLRLTKSDPGWQPTRRGGRLLVRSAGARSPALQPGDEVVSIDDRPVAEGSRSRLVSLPPGAAYALTVRREGRDVRFELLTQPVPASQWLMLFALTVLLPAVCFSTGLAVFLLKPDDKQATLLALLFAVFIPPMAFHWYAGLPAPLAFLMYLGPLVTPLAFFLLLHLFLVFPARSPALRRFAALEWLLYLPYPVLFVPRNVMSGSDWGVSETRLLDAITLFVIDLYFAGAFVSLVVNYRRAGATGKRKLRVVVAGTLAGMLPGALVFFSPLIDLAHSRPALEGWLAACAAVAFSVVPVSFAYAIARHQVIPVNLIIRRGVQYLLAKNALRVLLALPVVGLVVSIAADPNRTLAEIALRNSFYFYVLLIAALALGLVFRRRLSDWVDRKFFREAYDQEKILRALVEDVKGLDSMPEMSRRVSQEVERALHPEHVYLFYREREHGDLSLSYTSGGSSHGLRIPDSFQLLRLMELQGGAQDFPFPPKTNLPQSEKDWLAALGARLVVPLTGTDSRLAGLFLLGEKKSEVPYTARDRELLEAVASQIAIVYENLRLKGRVREDRKIRAEVLSRFEGRNINLLKECPRCGRCFDSSATVCDAEGAELTLSLPVEREIEGRYRLERLIGKGGMGAVYEATHLKLRHRVAIKILGGSMFGDAAALRRFEREARSLARLSQHPHIVAVHDYGELRTEGAFLVMDLIDGESLAAILRRERRLTPQRAADLFDQILDGLQAAHDAGIVHRDLKPDNVLVALDAAGRDHARLLDFGLAKLSAADGADSQSPTVRDVVTTPGAVLGTFGYMPPEQLTGGRVGAQSDLFSVGVMVVEALTGERPFKGRTLHELLTNILRGAFHLRGGAPEVLRLDAALQKCLAKDPAARYASALEARRELIPLLRDCPPAAFLPDEAETVILEG